MKTLILLLTLLFALPASAQWQPTTGPDGGHLTNLITVNGKLIAEVRANVLYRLDGQRWTKLPGEVSAYEYYSVGGNLLHTRHDGIYLSSDEGNSWTRVLQQHAATNISIDHDTLYSSHANAVYRSNDKGLTWTEVVHQPAVHNVTGLNGIVLAAPVNGTGVLRSINGGSTFTASNAGLPDTVKVGRVTSDHGFFYLGTNAGLFISADGLLWSRFEQGLPNGMPVGYKRMKRAGDFTFLHTVDTVYIATLNGWKLFSPRPILGLTEHESVFYATIGDRIMTSFFMGDSWVKTTPDLLANTIRHIVAANQSIMATGASGIFATDDDGLSWSRVSDMRATQFISVGSSVFAFGQLDGKLDLIKSFDQGAHWTSLTFPNDSVYNLSALARTTSYLYAGLSNQDIFNGSVWYAGGVLRSSDRGVTWERASNGIPMKEGVHAPVIAMYADEELQLASTVEGLYRSTDGGDNWTITNYGHADQLPSNPIHFQRVGNAVYAASTNIIYRTTDHGANWTKLQGEHELIMNMGRFEDSLYIIVSDYPRLSMQRLRENGIGQEWVNINHRLPEDIEPMTVLEGGLRAYLGSLGDGVWVLRKQPARVEDVNVMTGKAYPNPATEFVTIELGEQMQGTAKVTIVNTLGATELFVSTSIEGDKIKIDVQDLPSGSYEYTIETNTKLIRGKVTIQR